MTPNKKTLTSLIIFCLAALLFIVFVIYPLFNGIKKNSQDFIFQKKTLAELRIKIKNLKNFQTTRETYQANLEKLSTLFINSAEPIDFIEFLEREARDCQLLLDISPFLPREIEDDLWLSMNFLLDLTGSFSNFLKFLEKLESSPYLIEILNLNTRRLTEKDIKAKEFEEFSAGDVSATLLIKTFAK